MSTTLRAYVAGPLFDEGERWFIEKVEALVAECGFVTFLPHRANPPKDEHNVRAIFLNDKRGIDTCDVVVANLNRPGSHRGLVVCVFAGSAEMV